MALTSPVASVYPSPPPLDSDPPSDDETMGGYTTNIDGVGVLNIQRALDIARNTEGELDPSINQYLEIQLTGLWRRIQSHRDYILNKDEFALFNFYRARFADRPEAQAAVQRYWSNTYAEPRAQLRMHRLHYTYYCTRRDASRNKGIVSMGGPITMCAIALGQGMSRHGPEDGNVGQASPQSIGQRNGKEYQASATNRPFGAVWVLKLGSLMGVLSNAALMLLITSVFITRCQATAAVGKHQHHARAVANSLLEVFEVYPPVLTVTPNGVLEITDGSSDATVPVVDSGRPTCQETLAVHVFAFSFGAPYVANYKPPSCDFNRVSWNLTVTSAGRQFDRLGIVYLGDTEIFRTSTAQPTLKGIKWTYIKDMTNYLPLFKKDQKLIFDLGNLVNDIYTGTFNVTLTSAFFTADDSITPADLILPVSGRKSSSNEGSVFSVPLEDASNDLTLPRNVKKAVFTIAATGQSEEEFWWSNVLQSQIDTFPDSGTLYGFSPFREVQLLIDGNLAGVAWPFPIIFTGGVVPGFWRPIVGTNAYDLKEDEIDITPWLPLLCDGNAHKFTIRVSGLNDSSDGSATLSGTTGSYWWVTGKVFVWLDETGHITTGQGPEKVAPTPKFEVTSTIGKMRNGSNETLVYQVTAQRSLSFKSTINLSSGSETAFWSQDLSFSNFGNLTDRGNVAVSQQQTTGHDVSSSGYALQISYPLYAYTIVTKPQGNTTIVGTVNRGKSVQTIGEAVFPTGLESFSAAEAVHDKYASFQGASLNTSQQGQAYFTQNATSKASFGFGSTEQVMTFSGVKASQNGDEFPSITGSSELFRRHVAAVNGTVTQDESILIGDTIGHSHGTAELATTYALVESKQGYGAASPGGAPRGGAWHGLKRRQI